MIRWKDRNSKQRRSFAGESWGRYCAYPATMEAGNTIELLVDAEEAYPAMLEGISRARKTILMDSYIFNNDQVGKQFSRALRDAARRDVKVYLIVDGVGTWYVSSEFFLEMEESGVHVLIYRSPAPWRKSFGLLRRDHRKLLVIDGGVGFAGGLNIGAEWLPRESGGRGWHDLHLRIVGPAVRELSKLAISTWHIHADIMLDSKLFLPEVPPAGIEFVNIIGSREIKKRKVIRRSYLTAIRQARQYIYIANAYFLPDLGFRRALGNACRRGVDVRVMLPEKGDILAVQLASQSLYSRLLKAGIRLFLWRSAVLHAKSATIDGEWATVGSFNIDHRSWTMNLEVNVNSVGPSLSERLKGVFLEDQKQCKELALSEWRKRPILQRILERFCFLFRKWM